MRFAVLSAIVVVLCRAHPVAAQPSPPPGPEETPEREISLPDLGSLRLSGFFVGSGNYNSRIQMVPEFAAGAPVSSEPGHIDFRFDQFSIGAFRTFGSWLSAAASIEVERHSQRHSHGFAPDFGCVGPDPCVEQFGTEAIETEVSLHRFNVTAIAPLWNGIAFSVGRFDTPFGYELEVAAWIVNRWENETTEDPLEDNNAAKSVGGRFGFTPIQGSSLLNIGIGGFWGPEKDGVNSQPRWIVDADVTWSPSARLLIAAEFVHGGESGVSFRPRGIPIAAPAVNDADVGWNGLYVLAHYDLLEWLGVSARYGLFDDPDGARTGVAQTLQSFTLAPILHLSRLVPDVRPLGVTYARTRHPLDWVDVRLEYRFWHSDKPVFADVAPGIPILSASQTAHQVTLQFVANY